MVQHLLLQIQWSCYTPGFVVTIFNVVWITNFMLSYQGFSSVELHEFCCAAPGYYDMCKHNTTVSSKLMAFLEVFQLHWSLTWPPPWSPLERKSIWHKQHNEQLLTKVSNPLVVGL